MDRKQQQRLLSADPQNLAWRDDSEGIGQKLMQKMGWTGGATLKTSTSTSPTKVPASYTPAVQKRDLSGLGMSTALKQKEKEASAVQAVSVFDSILKNLAAAAAASSTTATTDSARRIKKNEQNKKKKEKTKDAESLKRVKSIRRKRRLEGIVGVGDADLLAILGTKSK